MAVSQAQKVDLLYKQAFGVTKTDNETNKSPSNESIPSPLLNRGDTAWTQADQIPATASAVAGVVQAYTGASAVQCTADNTTVPISSVYPTWKTNLTNWVPVQFGSTYNVKVYVDSPGVANPTITGTEIFAAGSGGTGEYYFNYVSGVLNFIGESIPASLTSGKVLYIVGYRYIGLTGVSNLPTNTTIGNINITDTTISSVGTNRDIVLDPSGTGIVNVQANLTASYFIGNGSQLTGIVASSGNSNYSNYSGYVTEPIQSNITSLGTLTDLTSTGTVNFTGASNVSLGSNTNVHITGGTSGQYLKTDGLGNLSWGTIVTSEISNGTSNVAISTANGNVTTSVNGTANVLVISNVGMVLTGNLQVTGNATIGNVSATNITATNLTGTLTTASQPNITTVGTLGSLSVTGNITAGNVNGGNLVNANYFSGDGSLLTNLNAANIGNVSNSNYSNFAGTAYSVSGSNVVGQVANANYATYSGTAFSVSGSNVTSEVANANYATYSGTAFSVSGSNVSGQVGNSLVAGTVYTNAQPNITSVGTLSSLTVSGVSNLNSVGNIIITGGSTGYVLTTNGDGNLSWQAAGSSITNGFVNIQKNEFTANGLANTFTLSKAPGSEYNIIVNIDGLIQQGSTYSISGTSLIFVSTPYAGQHIEVTIFDTIGAGANSQVLYNDNNVVSGSSSFTFDAPNSLVSITNLKVNDFYSNRTPIAVTTNTIIDSFSVNKYRSAKYTMRVNSDSGYQAVEVLLIHDGSSSFVTIYGSISTIGSDIIALTSDISSGNVRMLATTSSANTTVNLLGTYVAD